MKNLIIIIASLFLFSCGKYQKVLKSNDVNYKYSQAVKYYEKEDYNRALPLFNELNTVMIGTSKMQDISYYFAYCHYHTGDYISAAYLFKRHLKNYPNSKIASECSYMSAYCYYLEAPNYSLDARNTHKAIKEMQRHIDSYPDSDNIMECNKLIDELRNKLAKKAFENAKQYFTTEKYKSAIIALENVMIDFPSINNREEIQFLIINSSYLLAVNSIGSKIEERLLSTIDLYQYFKENYPNSVYLKTLSDIYTASNLLLKKTN